MSERIVGSLIASLPDAVREELSDIFDALAALDTELHDRLSAVFEAPVVADLVEPGAGPCPACYGPHDLPCLALPPDMRGLKRD